MISIYLMNNQWMTTLFTKLKKPLNENLKKRGFKLDPLELLDFLQNLSPNIYTDALEITLRLQVPFFRNLGFRVVKMQREWVEILIPPNSFNQSHGGGLHEAVILGASMEALRLLWSQHQGTQDLDLRCKNIDAHFEQKIQTPIRLYFEMTETTRETLLALLRKKGTCEYIFHTNLQDENSHILGEVSLTLEIQSPPSSLPLNSEPLADPHQKIRTRRSKKNPH